MHWIGRLHETRSFDRPIAKMRAAAAPPSQRANGSTLPTSRARRLPALPRDGSTPALGNLQTCGLSVSSDSSGAPTPATFRSPNHLLTFH